MIEKDNNLSPQKKENASKDTNSKAISVPIETVQAYYALPFMKRVSIPQTLTAIA